MKVRVKRAEEMKVTLINSVMASSKMQAGLIHETVNRCFNAKLVKQEIQRLEDISIRH